MLTRSCISEIVLTGRRISKVFCDMGVLQDMNHICIWVEVWDNVEDLHWINHVSKG